MKKMYSYFLIAAMALTTMAIRFLPFVLFKEKTPAFIMYLGKILPYCTMAMLVVFCLKDVNITSLSGFMLEMIAVMAVILLHKWKHNTSLSIVVGTVIYMFLVQRIFR